MTKKSIAAVALLLVLLAAILTAPYLLLRQQERTLLGRAVTQTVEESQYMLERDGSTLLDRLRLSVNPDAAQSWLAQEMVGERFGHWETLASRIRQELQQLLGVSAGGLGQYTDLRVLYYYDPENQRAAAFASCVFSRNEGQLGLELDLQDYKITALDLTMEDYTGSGVLQTLAMQLQNWDWARRWAGYLGLEYLEDGRPDNVFRAPGGKETVIYHLYTDGNNFSWRPYAATP